MKWIRFASAIIVTLGLTTVAQANILNLFNGSGKSCGCATSCQPTCCKPTITRPCERTVHTYQRQISDKKKPCCKPQCCQPAPKCCQPAPKCCKPTSFLPIFRPTSFLQITSSKCCQPAPKCCAPKKCCEPKKCCQPRQCCQTKCCNADPCEIAELIYKSQTACYARHRRRALDRLGDRYDCKCNPEIMAALVYGLNDADESVRKEAADEIGDQLRMNCCCSKEVTAALTTALADCDWGVRRQAKEALEACGYEVVDGCCNTCKKSCCGHGHSAEPTPAPPSESKSAYSPTLRRRSSSRGLRLASLFRLFD